MSDRRLVVFNLMRSSNFRTRMSFLIYSIQYNTIIIDNTFINDARNLFVSASLFFPILFDSQKSDTILKIISIISLKSTNNNALTIRDSYWPMIYQSIMWPDYWCMFCIIISNYLFASRCWNTIYEPSKIVKKIV